jgi:hypothetical protein
MDLLMGMPFKFESGHKHGRDCWTRMAPSELVELKKELEAELKRGK